MRRWFVPAACALSSVVAVEGLLHGLTATGALGFLRTSTPACYTSETARYGLDASGSPVWRAGQRLAGKKTPSPSLVAYDSGGWRVADAERRGTGGRAVGFFGDSYTAGLQVADAATYPRLWEARERAGGADVVAYNFGVDGTGTWHQYLRWRTLSQEVELDHVVLGFLPQNDVLNNHERLGAPWELPGAPYLTVRDGAFVPRAAVATAAEVAERVAWTRAVVGHSFLLTTAHKALRHLRTRKVTPASTFQERRTAWLGVYGDPPDDDWTEAWALTEEVLARFARDVRASGAAFTLVLVPDSLQIAGDELLGADLAATCDFAYPNRRLRAFCRERGIACRDALPTFLDRKRALEPPYFSFPDDGHYSALGHASLAEVLDGLDDQAAAAAPATSPAKRDRAAAASLSSL